MSDKHPQILFIMADLSNVAAVAGTGVNPWVSAGLGIASFGYNHWMYNKQKDFNVEMWNMQNEYNKPVNQKQRLLEAGMNPLYYGLDGNSAGTPQAAPTPQYTDPIQAATLAANLKNLQAQTNLTNEEANKARVEADNMKTEGARNTIRLYYDEQQKKFDFEPRFVTTSVETNGVTSEQTEPSDDYFTLKAQASLKSALQTANKIKSEADEVEYRNIYTRFREPYFEQFVENELKRDGATAEQARWAVKSAEETFKALQFGNKFSSLDFGSYKDAKEIEDSLGWFGAALRYGRYLIKGDSTRDK